VQKNGKSISEFMFKFQVIPHLT